MPGRAPGFGGNMSRTFRRGADPTEWAKPWKAIGDHGPHFFSTAPKRTLKKMTSGKARASERRALRGIADEEGVVIDDYKKSVSPWEINWFRD